MSDRVSEGGELGEQLRVGAPAEPDQHAARLLSIQERFGQGREMAGDLAAGAAQQVSEPPVDAAPVAVPGRVHASGGATVAR